MPPLKNAGLTALAEDGNEATYWVAIGDGPTAADQTSAQRRQLSSSVAAATITATGVPYAYTGTPGDGATHALFFSASTGGTFYGSEELTGDQTFNAAGEYNLTSLTFPYTGS